MMSIILTIFLLTLQQTQVVHGREQPRRLQSIAKQFNDNGVSTIDSDAENRAEDAKSPDGSSQFFLRRFTSSSSTGSLPAENNVRNENVVSRLISSLVNVEHRYMKKKHPPTSPPTKAPANNNDDEEDDGDDRETDDIDQELDQEDGDVDLNDIVEEMESIVGEFEDAFTSEKKGGDKADAEVGNAVEENNSGFEGGAFGVEGDHESGSGNDDAGEDKEKNADAESNVDDGADSDADDGVDPDADSNADDGADDGLDPDADDNADDNADEDSDEEDNSYGDEGADSNADADADADDSVDSSADDDDNSHGDDDADKDDISVLPSGDESDDSNNDIKALTTAPTPADSNEATTKDVPTLSPTVEFLPYIERNDDYINEDDVSLLADDDFSEAIGKGLTQSSYQSSSGNSNVVIGWLITVSILGMIFTAYQMAENPDGVYASFCRLLITISACLLKAVTLPCRLIFCKGRGGGGHHMIGTPDYRDSYRGRHGHVELT